MCTLRPLSSDETDSFRSLTASIIRAIASGEKEEDEESGLKKLLIARRRIVETTETKLTCLRKVLEARAPQTLEHSLIYASAKNPEQFEEIGRILDDLRIRWAPVTEETTKSASLLADTLKSFASGGYQVLLAKKVLDEGVDIPSIREAFIVASSTVEREWVQRRGRVLRTNRGKSYAVVHDFLGLPPRNLLAAKDQSLSRLLARELGRALAFAEHSRNALGKEGVIAQVQNIRSAYWSNGAHNTAFDLPRSTLIASSTPRGKLC